MVLNRCLFVCSEIKRLLVGFARILKGGGARQVINKQPLAQARLDVQDELSHTTKELVENVPEKSAIMRGKFEGFE
jgi:hypothetical protein